jgi:hypothetical protein
MYDIFYRKVCKVFRKVRKVSTKQINKLTNSKYE